MDAEAKYWKDKWMESERRNMLLMEVVRCPIKVKRRKDISITRKVVKEFDKASKGKSLPARVKKK